MNAGRTAAWLRAAIEGDAPVLWTGHGASLALAHVFAECLRERGTSSFALTAAELRAAGLRAGAVVSRSCRGSLSSGQLIVTEAAEDNLVPSGACVIEVPHVERQAWMPLRYFAQAVSCFAQTLGIGLQDRYMPDRFELPHRRVVVVWPGPARGAALLLDAAEAKLGPLDILVLEADELGHGYHARLALDAHLHHVLVPWWDELTSASTLQARRWLARIDDLAVDRLELGGGRARGAGPLMLASLSLELVTLRCRQRGIDWRTRPISADLDGLRYIEEEEAHG